MTEPVFPRVHPDSAKLPLAGATAAAFRHVRLRISNIHLMLCRLARAYPPIETTADIRSPQEIPWKYFFWLH